MALKLVAPSGSPAVLIAGGRPYQVGRAVASDLAIQDPTVSRRHAELELTGAGLRVRDLGSTNGTFLNGQRVSDAVAMPGSRVSFGKVDFEVREESAPAQTPGPAEGSLDATILRQVRVRGPADIAAQLSDDPLGSSALRIGGASRGDRQERKLALLLDIAKELSQQPEVDRLLDRVVGLTFQVMNVDRVAILMPDPAHPGHPGGSEGDLTPRVWRSRVDGQASSWRVPRSIVRKAVEDRV
ncbi:MAG TPA: FHA domain-containing protein, partial [Thermoanaerobaculia bacterium]|nr:FHA domain-containing protein [Thermoanaerobaculia bacterium]